MRKYIISVLMIVLLSGCANLVTNPWPTASSTLVDTVTATYTPIPPATRTEEAKTQTPIPPETVSPSPTPPAITICQVHTGFTNGKVKFRGGPGFDYAVLGTLSEGEIVTLLSDGQGDSKWSKVTNQDGVNGYTPSSFLECKGGK